MQTLLATNKAIDSALIQWHRPNDMHYSSPMMLRDPVGMAIIFQGGRGILDHNSAKM